MLRRMKEVPEQELIRVLTNLVAFLATLQHPSKDPIPTTCSRNISETYKCRTPSTLNSPHNIYVQVTFKKLFAERIMFKKLEQKLD